MTFKVINSLVLVVWWWLQEQQAIILRRRCHKLIIINLARTLLVVLKFSNNLKFYLNYRSFSSLNSIQKHTTWFCLRILTLIRLSSSNILLFCSLLTMFLNLLRWWTFNLGGIRVSFIWMVKR
jgi:hypothetical protein